MGMTLRHGGNILRIKEHRSAVTCDVICDDGDPILRLSWGAEFRFSVRLQSLGQRHLCPRHQLIGLIPVEWAERNAIGHERLSCLAS